MSSGAKSKRRWLADEEKTNRGDAEILKTDCKHGFQQILFVFSFALRLRRLCGEIFSEFGLNN
jgi:hypothetical protein